MKKYLLVIFAVFSIILIGSVFYINKPTKQALGAGFVLEDVIIDEDEMFGKLMPEWVEQQDIKAQLKKQGIKDDFNNKEEMNKILKKYGVSEYHIKYYKEKELREDKTKTVSVDNKKLPIVKD